MEVKMKCAEINSINKNNRSIGQLCIACLICGEPVPLTENEEIRMNYGHPLNSKVCDKCRHAILHIRNQLEKGPIVHD